MHRKREFLNIKCGEAQCPHAARYFTRWTWDAMHCQKPACGLHSRGKHRVRSALTRESWVEFWNEVDRLADLRSAPLQT